MKNTIYRDDPTVILIEDYIGKTPDHRPSIFLMNFDVKFGRTANTLDARIDATEEFFSQAKPALLVPIVRFADVLLGFRGEYQLSGHSDSGSWLSLPAKRLRRKASSKDSLCGVPTPPFANRGRERRPG